MENNLENKKIMACNIQKYMELCGKNRQDVCKDLNLKYTTFTDWVNGNTYPRIDKIELLASYFGVTKADLVESTDEKEKNDKGIKVPVVGRVAAGIPFLAQEDILDYESVDPKLLETGKIYGLIIAGNSMEPSIPKGSTAIVRCQDDVDDGDLAIVLVNGEDATCKRVKKYADSIGLISNNPSYSPRYFTKDEQKRTSVKIIGKVMEIRTKYY